MTNNERGKQKPKYFIIKDNDILRFLPISSKIDKYQKIIDRKVKKHAILSQNAFPTLEKYIDHIHLDIHGKSNKYYQYLNIY